MNEASEKAAILIEAVRYIRQFEGKIVVIKYGGNAMGDDIQDDPVLEDIAMLSQLGLKIVVVHGGGPKIDEAMKKHGIEKKVLHGLRVTDAKAIEVVQEVLRDVNKQCVKSLQDNGADAEDCTEGMFVTEIIDPDLGFVGEIQNVNEDLLRKKIRAGIVPVVSSLGKTADGQATNINADTAATEISIALKAEKLTILTNVDGVISSRDNLISHLGAHEVEYYIQSGAIRGGMIPKIRACYDAVNNGVAKAHLINGTRPRALLVELFTDTGIGTEIVK